MRRGLMASSLGRVMKVATIVFFLFLSMLLEVPETSSAASASGKITVNPGQTIYVSFGECASGDLLLWSLDIHTLSTILRYWLESPTGTHYGLTYFTDGRFVDCDGIWKLGFSIDSSGFWGATIYYRIHVAYVTISTPQAGFVNNSTVAVSGTVDRFATQVAVSLDGVHYETAGLYLGSWNKQVVLPSDGAYTIYAEARLCWESFVFVYYDSVQFVLDTVPPSLYIISPSIPDSKISRDSVTITWLGSDNVSGLHHYEIRITGGDWINVGQSTSYTFSGLDDKWYTVTVKAVDEAGNSAQSSVGFGIYTSIWSTNGPYKGIPLFALIGAVIVGVILALFLLRKRKDGSASSTVSQKEPPKQSQE